MGPFDRFRWRIVRALEPATTRRVALPAASNDQKSFALVEPARVSRTRGFFTFSAEEAVKDGLASNTTVYRCVTERAKLVASVPAVVQQRANTSEPWEPVEDNAHPLVQLLANPNQDQSYQQFVEMGFTFLLLTGEFPQLKARLGNDEVRELWLVSPDAIEAKKSKQTSELVGWELTQEYRRGGVKFIPTENLIMFNFPNPSDPVRGLAPLKVAERQVDTDKEAVAWNFHAMLNRAVKSGIVSPKTGPLTQEQYDHLVHAFQAQQQGADGAWGVVISSMDLGYQSLSQTPVEMDFLQGRRFTAIEICNVFGIPVPLVLPAEGSFNADTRASARLALWEDTIVPDLRALAGAWNQTLVPEFGDPNLLRVWHDVSNVEAFVERIRARIQAAKTLWDMGVPFNVINEKLRLGFPSFDGDDLGYVSGGLLPSSTNPFTDL